MKNNILRTAVPFLYLLLYLPFIWGCTPHKEDDYRYFQNLTTLGEARLNQPEEMKALVAGELEKYKETGDKKHLIASKYVETFLDLKNKGNTEDKIGLFQLPIIYDLLKMNNGQYSFVSIACNFNLAYKFEKNSPTLSMQFLDKAIDSEERSGGRRFLPHMYHFKGRLYYNAGDYKNAMIYFDKALKAHDQKKDQIYIASMHNNFAMCYDKMKLLDRALQEADTAIHILENIPQRKLDATHFLAQVKVSKGHYQYKLKEYAEAEKTLLSQLEF